jgi:hypothetical protein
MLNPIRDPSLLLVVLLTLWAEGGTGDPLWRWVLTFVAAWVAVKAVVWLCVNVFFSSMYLTRKAGWVFRNPRLAWRLLDALGTEEIIIGGLRPDMFATDDGSLHAGAMASVTAAPNWYGGMAAGYMAPPQREQGGGFNSYGPGAYERATGRPDTTSDQLRQLMSTYARLISDWTEFTEEKWRTVSDSQLGWKPLRGRWNGWDEIYSDSWAANTDDPMARASQAAGEAMARRFTNAREKGSAASSVACFLRDLDTLRQSLMMLDMPDDAGVSRMGGIGPKQPISQRTGKAPIIRNPMIVDAD